MENLKFPESWDQAKRHSILKNTGLGTSYEYDIEQAARIMAESYEKRIAELENKWISFDKRLTLTRFDLEKAFLAGDKGEDFEEWYQKNYR